MRKYLTTLLLMGILTFQVSDLKALDANNQNKELNMRIKNLQTRLQDFHRQASKKIESRLNYPVSAESIIIPVSKYQPQISIEGKDYVYGDEIVELDDNEKASVVVLYHDSQFFDEQKKETDQSEFSEKNEPNIEIEKDEIKISNIGKPIYSAENNLKTSRTDYLSKYSEMKRKILMVYSGY